MNICFLQGMNTNPQTPCGILSPELLSAWANLFAETRGAAAKAATEALLGLMAAAECDAGITKADDNRYPANFHYLVQGTTAHLKYPPTPRLTGQLASATQPIPFTFNHTITTTSLLHLCKHMSLLNTTICTG